MTETIDELDDSPILGEVLGTHWTSSAYFMRNSPRKASLAD